VLNVSLADSSDVDTIPAIATGRATDADGSVMGAVGEAAEEAGAVRPKLNKISSHGNNMHKMTYIGFLTWKKLRSCRGNVCQ
jgi:hypothetical protein